MAAPTGQTEKEAPGAGPQPSTKAETGPKRFHGSVILDSTRVGRDAGRIADEVISHLVGLVGANVTVTLEIDAEIPSGTPDNVVTDGDRKQSHIEIYKPRIRKRVDRRNKWIKKLNK